ncbi:hypothetical protein FRC00_012083, partial [Tulasnella sp. 408]
MIQGPVTKFDALPPELYLLIARLSIAESGHKIRDTIRVSSVNSQMRNIAVNTSDLWTEFTLSNTTSSHKLGSICVSRSGNRTLDLQISLNRSMEQDKGVSGFFECFKSASPRIARLSVHIYHPFSLKLINALLKLKELRMLRSIDVGYDNEEHEGFDRYITLPSSGADLHSISLTGVQAQPLGKFDLRNLTSLHIGAGEHWKWLRTSISPLLQSATALQELHFVGDKGTFHVVTGEGTHGFLLTLPALRRIRFVNTAPEFLAPFLCQVTAPLLEEVDVTAPPRCAYNEEGQNVFAGWTLAVGSIKQNPVLTLPARTLKLRNGGAEYSKVDLALFVIFLVNIFPHMTTLEIEAKLLSTSPIFIALELGQNIGDKWMNIERLTICGHFNLDTEEEYEKV